MTTVRDALTTFDFEGRAARGAFVDLRAGLDPLFGHRAYSPDVCRLLGEALAASPLLASNLKFKGRINLQFQGSGPINLLVTQIDDALVLRGMAKADAGAAGSFMDLLGGGTLALMLEPRDARQSYQALVPIEGRGLATALEHYYAQSEQLPTRLCLAAAADRLVGLLLQRIPTSAPQGTAGVDDDWARLCALFDTLGPEEMLAVDGGTLLHRLFHAEPLRLFEPRPVHLACRCSRASISRMLLALGAGELEPLLVEQGKIEVTCEFCGRPYVYPEIEVRELLAAVTGEPDPAVRH